jgi:hypothetical protein
MAMSGRLVLRAYDHLVELLAEDHVLEMARERLPDSYRPGRGRAERTWAVHQQEIGWRATVDGEHLGARPDASTALEAALSDLELWVAERASRYVFVHAGCVAVDDRAILLPGLTMTGKTTIVDALARAGADYYSDEFAPIDRRGFVRPYARPLTLRHGALAVTPRDPVELGLSIGTAPARVVLVALLRFDRAAGWNVAPLSRPRTILGLLENTVPAQSRAAESLAAIERATAFARGLLGTRGDAEQAAAIIIEILRS